MKKILLFICLLIGMASFGQIAVLTTNNIQTVTGKTLYGTQNTLDSIYAANILNLVDSITAHAGGSTLFALTGTNTATGAVIADLDGNPLSVQQGGNDFLILDPTVDAEAAVIQAINVTGGGNLSDVGLTTSDVSSDFEISSSFNAYAKEATISGIANTTTSTLQYAADSHTFEGNVGIGTTPTAAQLLVVNDGTNDLLYIDTTNFYSGLFASDGTAISGVYVDADLSGDNVYTSLSSGDGTGYSELDLYSEPGNGYTFNLYSNDGTNEVDINGDAVAQTIALTAANGVIFSTSHTPSSASDTGIEGTIAWDTNYIYIATATDTWKRVAISTW